MAFACVIPSEVEESAFPSRKHVLRELLIVRIRWASLHSRSRSRIGFQPCALQVGIPGGIVKYVIPNECEESAFSLPKTYFVLSPFRVFAIAFPLHRRSVDA